MKLADALKLNLSAQNRDGASRFSVSLVSGFTTLQLGQFLTAFLNQRLSDRVAELQEPPGGDAVDRLDRVEPGAEAVFLIIEWQDLDPRLGLRQADWRPDLRSDILETVSLRLKQLTAKVRSVAESTPVYLSLPRLPLPPVSSGSSLSADFFTISLKSRALGFAELMVEIPHVHVLSPDVLASSRSETCDVKGDLRFAIPYSQEIQSRLTEALVDLAFPALPPLKGLITDLDDTLWRGIIGETGPEEVYWDLDHHSHMHAIYQNGLQALNEMGVLLAIASKNEPATAEAGLERSDLRVEANSFFPREIHWEPKSLSVTRILDQWRIGPESVLFVDNSESELAEVATVHPGIQTRLFPTGDDPGILDLILEIRDLFGRNEIGETDRLRVRSLRPNSNPAVKDLEKAGSDPEAFLRNAEGVAKFGISNCEDARAFELINKTNQFNLNGIRLSERDWLDLRKRESSLILTVEYEDKFGKLGKVSVLTGNRDGDELEVESWVLSCRAFSRRLEYLCLRFLFEQQNFESLRFRYRDTGRNRPLTLFFAEFVEAPTQSPLTLTKEAFLPRCPPLYQSFELVHDPEIT